MRALLTLLLSIGLLTNICTGGVFALLSDASLQIVYTEESSWPMSYGSIGILTCENSERAEEDEVDILDVRGCGDVEECILQLSLLTHDELVESAASNDDYATTVLSYQHHDIPATKPTMLARAGPLYPEAPSLARSLVKRE